MEMTDRFLDLCNQQFDVLDKMGYNTLALAGNTNLKTLLAEELDMTVYLASKSMEPEDFQIGFKGRSGNSGEVVLLFDFRYHPEREDLQMRVVQILADGVSKYLEITDKQPLPHADKLLGSIRMQRRISIARKILRQATRVRRKLFNRIR